MLVADYGWAALAVAIAASLWLQTVYRSRIARVGRAIRTQTAAPFNPDPRPAPPAVSVIVVAGSDAQALEKLLDKLFEQEYPSAEMEVIVVNDGKSDEVKDAVTRIKHLQHRPNLYITFAPATLRNVSHRKLAVSLGVKAAKHPVVMLLSEHSRLFSRQWLARMAAPFADPKVEVVLGSALPSGKADHGLGARYRSFTHGADATMWLDDALRGKPWRGHRANMAFRRDLFFSSGGFNGALNLRGGDDDIFVNKIARGDNTAVVLAAQAHVRYAYPTGRSEFADERPARFFTSAGLAKGSRRIQGLSSLMQWTLLLSGAVAAAVGIILMEWIMAGIAAALLLETWLTLSLTWRATLKALRCRPALLAIPARMLRRPFTNLCHKARARRRKTDYYTWS